MTNHSQILKAAHAQARRTMVLGTVYLEQLAIAMRDMYAFARKQGAIAKPEPLPELPEGMVYGFTIQEPKYLQPGAFRRHNLAV